MGVEHSTVRVRLQGGSALELNKLTSLLGARADVSAWTDDEFVDVLVCRHGVAWAGRASVAILVFEPGEVGDIPEALRRGASGYAVRAPDGAHVDVVAALVEVLWIEHPARGHFKSADDRQVEPTLAGLTSGARYQTLFEHSPVSLWEEDVSVPLKMVDALVADGVTDVDSHLKAHPEIVAEMAAKVRIINVNEAACRFHRAASKTALLSNLSNVFTSSSLQTFAEQMCVIAAGGLSTTEAEVRTLDGEIKPVLVSASQIKGEARGHIIFSQMDLTRQKALERIRLAQARLEVTATLAGGIAHDFNNLMVGVIGNADLLQDEVKGQPEALEMLSEIAVAGRRAGELAQQLVAYARGGKRVLSAVDVNEVCDTASRRRAYHPGIVLELGADLPRLKAEQAQIRQVVAALLSNATEASAAGGRISMRTRAVLVEKTEAASLSLAAGRYVQIQVEDEGAGMAPDVLARVFEPFFSTKRIGRGLGLAAVHGIVGNHGGKITVESVDQGGTTATVWLPAIEDERVLSPAPVGISKSRTVLVVDDDPSVVRVTQRILERAGHTVITARHGLAGVEMAVSYPGDIDVTVLDMAMPVMNGREAFPLLRKARPEMRIVLCSGFDVDDEIRALLQEYGCAFLQKPFKGSDLISHISAVA